VTSILQPFRRPGSGAVLAFISIAIIGCGDSDNNPSGPEPPPDQGQTPVAGCSEGVLQHGGLYLVCFPTTWNGDLVIYAHGYVAPQRELALPNDVIGGQPVSGAVTALGYAYATTSYRANGLVAPDAVDDLIELVDTVQRRYRPDPARAVIVGFSEGGLVATLAAERHPDRFDGSLAGCGPIGNFRAQLDYIGDFRVVFDYLFPGLIPGSAVDIPDVVRDRWNEVYVPAIVIALAANPGAALELVTITGAPVAATDIRSIAETAVGILWYNVFGTADAQSRLGGQPFDNSTRVYSGSADAAALNARVARFSADPAALAALARFETSGNLDLPVVTLHTTGDPIVPFSQSALYGEKVTQAGSSALLSQIPVDRHGHCSFQAPEVLGAFATLMDKVNARPATTLASVSER
jgi:pimeloyl-ACP methyl ester carboxylesterase